MTDFYDFFTQNVLQQGNNFYFLNFVVTDSERPLIT